MFNEIEICYRHTNLVISKMNELYNWVHDGSEISLIFKENSVINNTQKIQTAIQNHSSLPKTNFSPKIIENEQIQLAYKTIIYFLKYLQFTQKQILQYNETALSSVFKCNQLLTIRFCHLIVIYSKIVFFFSKFPVCSQIILAFYAHNNSKGGKKEDAQTDSEKIVELLELVLQCTSNTSDPSNSEYLRSVFGSVKLYIQNIIFEIGNIIIGFNNNYNFEQFSIFYSEPPKMTTLPSLEYILMMNYSVIHDMLKIVFYIFNDLVIFNQSVALSVFSESTWIYLSFNVRYDFRDLKDFQTLIRDMFAKAEVSDDISKYLLEQISIDSQKSHINKIKHILFLLQDYLNYAHFSFDSVMDNYIKLVALTNYAIYEVSSFLTIQKATNAEINFVLELLTTLVDLIDVMNSKNDDIKRYYLFNLATNDLQFLIDGMKEFQMIDSPSDELLPMINFEEHKLNQKAEFLPIIYNELYLMAESLKVIDLEKYDSGENYNFLPFNINAGRLLFYFYKNMHNSSGEIVNRILEHLNTILLHIGFVENPYSSYCDFVFLNNFTDFLVSKRANEDDLSVNYFVPLLRILENLQKDERITENPINKANLTKCILTSSQSHFQYILSNVSPLMDNSFSSTPISVTSFTFKKSKSLIRQPTEKICESNLDRERKRKQATFMRKNYELYDLYIRLLQLSDSSDDQSNRKSILDFLKNQIVEETPLFAYHSHKNSNVLPKANHTLVEYFWPFFTILNLPFKRSMYNSRLNQSINLIDHKGNASHCTNFLQQFVLYDGNVGQKKTDKHQLYVQYTNYLEEFLNSKKYNTTLYQTANNGFYPSLWLSSAALKSIIDDFGPHMALNLDVVLTNHIANSIHAIYQNFFDNSASILTYVEKFRESSEFPDISELKENILPYCDEMIKLGSTVSIRRLLRSQTALSCEENVPGFLNVLAQGIKKSLGDYLAGSKGMDSLGKELRILCEVFGGSGGGSRNLFLPVDEEFSFVRTIIQSKKIEEYSDFSTFCFYLALMLLDDRFSNIRYHSDSEAIDGNVHLFPVAMGAIIDCGTVLFSCIDEIAIRYGLKKFLDAFALIYRLRSNRTLVSSNQNQNVPINETLESLQFLATIFPKYIRPLEYERIQEVLPLLEVSQILSETQKNKKLLQ